MRVSASISADAHASRCLSSNSLSVPTLIFGAISNATGYADASGTDVVQPSTSATSNSLAVCGAQLFATRAAVRAGT